MDPDPDFNFALELQLKDLGFLEEHQHLGDTPRESSGSHSDRAYAIKCMKEDLLSLQRQGSDLSPTLEPSRRNLSRLSFSPTPEPLDKKCVSCLEEYSTLIFTAPCTHGFCHSCTRRLILGAINEESQYPPRCCDNEVPRAVIRSVLNAEELKEYNAKTLEYTTKSRLYCAEPACAAFIPPSAISDEHGTCSKCGRLTHALCRALAHPEVDCPQDTALHDLLKVAEKKKWKRCSECRRMVELVIGCNHITCVCGYHFCYVCGKKWRTCGCAQWYEHQLILANEEFNDQAAAPVEPRRRQFYRRHGVERLRPARIRRHRTHELDLAEEMRRAAEAERMIEMMADDEVRRVAAVKRRVEREVREEAQVAEEELRWFEESNRRAEIELWRIRSNEQNARESRERDDDNDVVFLRSNPVRHTRERIDSGPRRADSRRRFVRVR